MHLWPVYTCQTFQLVERNGKEDQDLCVIDTLSLQQINCFVAITEKRIFIYQVKPFAPILIYDRSNESLEQFGANEKIFFNDPLKKVSGVNDDDDDALQMNENCIFYVKTSKNCLLIYEIKTLKNWINTFKIYGIEPRLENENILTKHEFVKKMSGISTNRGKGIFHLQIDNAAEGNIDDELLTIFDVKNNGKIIQNGFIIEKGKNLVQIMKEMFFIKSTFKIAKKPKKIINNLVDTSNDSSESQEVEQMAEEMPIRRCDVSLKTVLKFDTEIMDLQVFTRYIDGGIRQELIYLLFKDELSILTLDSDYNLDSKQVVNTKNNCKLSFNAKDIFFISLDDKDENVLIVNRIDKKNNVIYSKDLMIDDLKDFKLIKITNFKERYLVLTFDKMLIYYDTFLNTVYSKIKLLPTTGILSEFKKDKVVQVAPYDRELLTLLKQNGKFQVYTQWGNLQTEIDVAKLLKDETFSYSSFNFLDNLLIVANENGYIQIIDFYKQFRTSLANFKASSSYSLFNSNTNKIITFSSNDNFQYYLPTNSINNVISQIKYNGDSKFCLIYIANKNIILLKEHLPSKLEAYPEVLQLPLNHNENTATTDNLDKENILGDDEYWYNEDEYDGWLVFDNMDVSKIDWIDNRYSFLHINDLDNSRNVPSIVCLDFKKLNSTENYRSKIVHLLELRIWSYNITNEDEVLYWGCNTFSAMIKFVKKDQSDKALFKLGELNVLLRNNAGNVRLETIDILVHENDDQVRSFVRNQIDLSNLTETSISYKRNVKWICHCNKGTVLVYTGDDELHQISSDKNGLLETTILYTKVENIVEIYQDKISFVRGGDFITCSINSMMNIENKNITPLLKQSLLSHTGEYPILMDKNHVEYDCLKCVYSSSADLVNGFKLIFSKHIVLDKVVSELLKVPSTPVETIIDTYVGFKYFQFSLEKLMTESIIDNSDDSVYNQRLLDLITLFSSKSPNSDIEIYVNCIRKIDYEQAFKLLKFIKFEDINSLIDLVMEIEDLTKKSTLLFKVIIAKFNIDKMIDKQLLKSVISLLLLNAYQNPEKGNVERCYKMVVELVEFIDKFNSDNSKCSIDKDFIIQVIDETSVE